MAVAMFILVALIIVTNSASAIPKRDGDNEIIDKHKDPNILEQEFLHNAHLNAKEHDHQYDHEQFLGEEEAKIFNQLKPDESKRRLGVIVDRIDENKDGFVDMYELKQWIIFTKRRYIDEDVGQQWLRHNPDNNETISWEAYRKDIYGFMDSLTKEEKEHEEHGISYNSMLARDRRRWAQADANLDDSLTREEFAAFLHPEDHDIMYGVVLDETFEDIDKNKDGKITMDEYIGDVFPKMDEGEEEPEWVTSERETFSKFRDTDGNGYLDRDEIQTWIAPKNFDPAESEAVHLLYEADANRDDKLSKEEILEKYDVFVGSQVTDFGEALARHDEF